MNSTVRVALSPSPQQREQLTQLQHAFARACNELAPTVQQTRCWNRVALHHMAYKTMRERFPELGSQMVCNAIYSVSRAARQIYQHPRSPFNLQRLGARPLPLLHFLPEAPVYFDRHTLSIKDGRASMYTLDGRIRFELGLPAADEQRFREQRLREIALTGSGGQFQLGFHFADDEAAEPAADDGGELPHYLLVIDAEPHQRPQPEAPPAPAAHAR